MTIKPIVREEQILGGHPGFIEKSEDAGCVTNFFDGKAWRYSDSSDILDSTISSEPTTNCTEGELFVYRECGKTACQREFGIVIDADSRIIDAHAFVAPCIERLKEIAT
jgi:hypothetical protein